MVGSHRIPPRYAMRIPAFTSVGRYIPWHAKPLSFAFVVLTCFDYMTRRKRLGLPLQRQRPILQFVFALQEHDLLAIKAVLRAPA